MPHLVLVLVLFGAWAPRAASAQDWRRTGWWFEAGGGPSANRVACSNCVEVTRSGGSGAWLRFGRALSHKVVLGVEVFDFLNRSFRFDNAESLAAENVSIAGIVLWYPWRSRFFIKSGVGIAEGQFTVATAADEPVFAEGLGVGLTFGLGYDQPVWRSVAVTANAGVFFTAIGDVVLPAIRVDDVIATIYNLSLGITIR